LNFAFKLKNGDIENWKEVVEILDSGHSDYLEFSFFQSSAGLSIDDQFPEDFRDSFERYFNRSQGKIWAINCPHPTKPPLPNIPDIDNAFFKECVKFKQVIEFASRFGIHHIIPQGDWWNDSSKNIVQMQSMDFFYDLSVFAGKHKVRLAVPAAFFKAEKANEIRSFFLNRGVKSLGWCFEPDALQKDNIDPVAALERAGYFVYCTRFSASSVIDRSFDVASVLKSLSGYYDGPLCIQADNPAEFIKAKRIIYELVPDFDSLKSAIDHTRKTFPGSIAYPLDDTGSCNIHPDDKGYVGTYDTRKLIITVGHNGIKTGGAIGIRANHDCDMQCQVSNPEEENYISFKVISNKTSDVCLKADAKQFSDWTAGVELKVLAGQLSEGDKIEVVFGDTSHGSPGIKLQSYEDSFRFYMLIDEEGDGLVREIRDCPSFEIVGDKPQFIRLICPAVVRPGESFEVLLRAEDNYMNIATRGYGSLEISGKGIDGLSKDFRWPQNDKAIGKISSVSCPEEGIFYIEAKDTKSGICGLSTPVKCCTKSPKIFWGDIHSHSNIMDGTGEPDDNFVYARDIAGLDFYSLADHCDIDTTIGTEINSPQQWEIIKQVTKKYNDPGSFVTLLGYEIAQEEGDYNIYFETDEADWYIPSTTPWELLRWLRVNRYRALVIPHMTTYPVQNRGYDWNYYDPDFVRLAEIHSVHGTGDQWGSPKPLRYAQPGGYIQEALARGYKLGLMGSGDGHQGRPGNTRGRNWYVNGLVAVYADELTRENIFDSLYARRCYAATNARILIEFSINDVPMGQECFLWERNRFKHIKWTVAGTGEIEKVELLKNHNVEYSHENPGLISEKEYIDQFQTDHTDYYLLRVTQKDGHMAWSSPIWVSAGDKTPKL
jgi:hypothetical protein